MNVFSRQFLVFTLMTSFLGAPHSTAATDFYGPDDPNETRPGITMDAGYFIPGSLLDDVFFQYDLTQRLLAPMKRQFPYSITPEMMTKFEPIIFTLTDFIDEEKKGTMAQCEQGFKKCSSTFEGINGISERDLAIEITRAAYCFGTDPFVVASKIRQESRFDMSAVSKTGAIGLTQLTAVGLKEVLDQMGQRGEKYAFLENKEYLGQAIACYGQKASAYMLKDFPKINTAKLSNGRIEYTSDTIRALKAWVLPRTNMPKSENRKALIQRQLFLGNTLLKIYLAYSKKVDQKKPMIKQYESALRMFNGDSIRVKYAKDVIKNARLAQTL